MTHPEASPDGTGTQSEEVRAALHVVRTGSEYASIRRGAASVLSAEIERLARRVEELTLEKRLSDIGWDMSLGQTANHRERADKAEAALASAAAPDERVLTEREQYTVRELLTCRTFDYPRVMTEAHAIIQRLVSARTLDQDTAP